MAYCSSKGMEKPELRKGAWTQEEDTLLRKCIEKHGVGKWWLVPKRAGLNRCRKSCRLRWLNYLCPEIKRGKFKDDEDDLIIRLHKLLGNRWSLIAGRLPGRTANDVKNYWNSHLSKIFDARRQVMTNRNSTDVEIIKPKPQTLPANWTWPDDEPSDERNLDDLTAPTPTSTIENQQESDDFIMDQENNLSVEEDEELRIVEKYLLDKEDDGWDDLLNDINVWDYMHLEIDN